MRIRYLVIFLLFLGGTISVLEFSGIVSFFTGKNSSQDFFQIEDENFLKWAKSHKPKAPPSEYKAYWRTPFFEGPLALSKISKDKGKLYGTFNTGHQQYELTGKFEINWLGNKEPLLTFDILSGNIETIYGSANRISGSIAITQDQEAYVVDGLLNMGTLNYGGVSFQGNQMKIKGPLLHSSGSITGEIVGHTGSILEASGLFEDGQLVQMKGIFSVQSPYHLLQTVHTMAVGENAFSFTNWKNVPPLTFLLEETPKSTHEKRRYAMRIENMDDQFRGLISLNPELNLFRIVLETKEISGYPLRYNQELENGEKVSKIYADLILNGRNNDDHFGYAD